MPATPGLDADEVAILQAGLVALSEKKPPNPLEWLGQWLKVGLLQPQCSQSAALGCAARWTR